MNLENIVAVSGMPGLYRMAGSRSNGLIIEDFDTGKKRFASIRKHQFTPLESVSIYTLADTAPDLGHALNCFRAILRILFVSKEHLSSCSNRLDICIALGEKNYPTNNYSKYGGAISYYNFSSVGNVEVSLDDCELNLNSAEFQGGVIYSNVQTLSNISINNTTMNGNYAVFGSAIYSVGYYSYLM